MTNEGQGPWQSGESWVYVANPEEHVVETQGEVEQKVEGTKLTPDMVAQMEAKLSQQRSDEVKSATPKGTQQWSTYSQEDLAAPGSAD